MASDSGPASSDPLLPGRRAPSTGGWKSALFIIWVEVAERFAYYGISSNLISYLTGPLGQTTAAAAAAVNAWSGAAAVLPLLGAAVADSWLGRYRTIVASSVLYITGLGMLTLSSMFSSPQQCRDSGDGQGVCPPSSLQTAFFYVSLYLVAIAQSGHKPCVQAFGADQFDATDPDESVSRASFFNWWYMGLCTSATVTIALMSYVQDNVGWALGFGVPSMAMLLALAIFLLGTRTYRFYGSRRSNCGSASASASTFSLVRKAFVAWRKKRPRDEAGSVELGHGDDGELPQDAVLAEEVKGLARLFPIWATCLLYGVVFAQPPTLFTKQAATLDRRVGQSFQVPPAALQCFLGASIVTCIVLYDRVLVPVAHRVSGVTSGITMLQRIGTGIALSLVTLVVAALVEMKRLQVAREASVLVVADGSGTSPVPMSLWWIVPQYVLLGAGGRVHNGRHAGVLLRPGARGAQEPRAGALPERPRRRQLHQQRPHHGHRWGYDEERWHQLVRRRPQPGSPRLFLPAPCSARRVGASRFRLLLNVLRLQDKGSKSLIHGQKQAYVYSFYLWWCTTIALDGWQRSSVFLQS